MSVTLAALLREHRLCSAADLRRCRRIVRRLAADLPAFDSVWLDALAQLGRLTTFQVRLLESAAPSRIVLGPCLLVDQIAAGVSGTTYLVRHRESARLLVLKLVTDPRGVSAAQRLAWETLVTGLRRVNSVAICGPHLVDETPAGLVAVSPYVEGPTLQELLVRRGRFPPEIVADIGRQMLGGLAAAERAGLVHGDLRLANVRLTRTGQVVLLDCGIRPIVEPGTSIHARLPPDRYDGVAPELLSDQREADAVSDLYALGCLLWQLLAGRPPFPAGDPLLKLAAHQSRSVPDVRVFAPETPESLALLVGRLTQRNPTARPGSAGEAEAEWNRIFPPRSQGLKQFRSDFDHPRTLPGRGRGTRGATRITAAALLLVAVGLAFHRNPDWVERLRAPLLVADPTETAARSSEPVDRPEDSTDRSRVESTPPGAPSPVLPAAAIVESGVTRPLQKLPQPDALGVVVLSAGESYQASPVHVVGPLILRSEGGAPARIVVNQPWVLVAESIRLEGLVVDVQSSGPAGQESPTAAVELHAQLLSVERLVFEQRPVVDSQSPAGGCLFWELVDDRDTRPTSAVFTDCVFTGGTAALVVPQPVSVIQFTNCLCRRQDCILDLAGSARRAREVLLRLNHVTCRDMGGVLRWWGEEGPPAGLRVSIDTRDSLLHLRANDSSLCALLSQKYTSGWLKRLRVSGEGSLIAPEATLVVWKSDSTEDRLEIDSPELNFEGLLGAPFEFRGGVDGAPEESEILARVGPQRSQSPPGIDARRFRSSQHVSAQMPVK